jgi:hypothetical protein
MILVAAAAMSALSAGCMPGLLFDKVTDCSAKPECWGGFKKSATYVTVRPLLYARGSLTDHFFWDGNAPGSGSRVEFDRYQRKPHSYPGVTLIPAGTRIFSRKVQHRTSFEYSCLEIRGEMLDGPQQGCPVELTEMAIFPVKETTSDRGCADFYFEPNPAWIRIQEVEQSGTGQPATRPESKPEGNQKPQPKSDERSR